MCAEMDDALDLAFQAEGRLKDGRRLHLLTLHRHQAGLFPFVVIPRRNHSGPVGGFHHVDRGQVDGVFH